MSSSWYRRRLLLARSLKENGRIFTLEFFWI
jgi:hypothetical protein